MEILYAVPVGTVISWYPSPTAFQTNPNDPTGPKMLVYPPGFRMCDGSTVNDPESPFNGAALPNLVNRFILGSGANIAVGDSGDMASAAGRMAASPLRPPRRHRPTMC